MAHSCCILFFLNLGQKYVVTSKNYLETALVVAGFVFVFYDLLEIKQ